MSSIPYNTRNSVRTRRVSKVDTSTVALKFLSILVISTALTYAISAMAGQTMMEGARRQGLRDAERAHDAKLDVAILRQRVDRLSSVKSIEGWASMHGLVMPDTLVLPEVQKKPQIGRYLAINR